MVSTSQNPCPCGSGRSLPECCQPFLAKKRKPATATDLLRARYTAFTQGNTDYILDTHHSKTKADIKREEVADWASSSEWLKLEIVQSEAGGEKDEQGVIVFCAEYRAKADGKVVKHWEQSLFEKENGEWRFLDARGIKNEPFRRAEAKAGRNDPCPCGSGQKYKKCCATKSA